MIGEVKTVSTSSVLIASVSTLSTSAIPLILLLTDESAKNEDFKRALKSYEDFVKLNKPWDDISTRNFLNIRS